MLFKSLQSKIFFLMALVLIAVAITVMSTSRRNVSKTVIASEQHAINNVLDLIQHELAAHWSTLLENKVSIVRHGRHQLKQTGTIIEKTLALYENLSAQGILTTDAAQTLALDWINQLHFDGDHYAFVFNEKNVVLASGDPFLIGMNLSGTKDFKNRMLTNAVLSESRESGYSFAIYQRPIVPEEATLKRHNKAFEAERKDNFRYAYFGYFSTWNWIFAVSDSAAHVIKQIDEHRTQMEQSIRDTVLPLAPTESGFVFITTDDGHFIAKPPEHQTTLLNGKFADGRSLQQHLAAKNHPDLQAVRLETEQGIWQISSKHYAPLRWSVVVAIPQEDLSAPTRALLHSQAVIFAGLLVFTLLITWYFAAHIVRPLKRLTHFVRQLPDQALQPSISVPRYIEDLPNRHNDEVGRLATAFMYMDKKLRENIYDLMRETSKRERFESELNIARTIQLGLLPNPLSENTLPIDLSAVMQPAKEVGGDIYDYFLLPNRKLCIVIGDVSDKGVPAALFMAITRTLIRAVAEEEIEPDRIVNKLNNRLTENNPHMMFVTLIVGTLNLDNGDFLWVNAGHIPPLLISPDGKLRTLAGRSGPACGVQEDISYLTYHTHFPRGDTLFCYTDGVTENLDPTQQQYGEGRLFALLRKTRTSSSTYIDSLLDDLNTFSAGVEQTDDITVLAIKRL